MLFVGAIPREVVTQAFACVDMTSVKHAYVCCSGSYRYEQAISKTFPDIQIHSNDVSLLSTAIGRLAAKDPVDFHFARELEFLEQALGNGPTPLDRVAALAVAVRMCHFRGHNAHVQAHRDHYVANAKAYIEKARAKVADYVNALRVVDFYSGDFRDHAERARETGGTVFAWPPLFRGDYERFYRLIHNNVDWKQPEYRVFNPKELPDWLTHLRDTSVPYCVCSDKDLSAQGHKPVALFAAGRSKRIYLYSNIAKASSLIRRTSDAEPFRYSPLDPWKMTATSKVVIREAPHQAMNYIKDKYQAAGLVHTDGDMRCLVFVDDMLAGGFVYARMNAKSHFSDPRIGHLRSIYLLSDFSTTRERKVSKLIAMLASGQETARVFDRRKIQRTESIVTTAFSERPVSMKYRGIYELHSRKDAKTGSHASFQLNYITPVRRMNNDEIYADWWRRFGEKSKREESSNG